MAQQRRSGIRRDRTQFERLPKTDGRIDEQHRRCVAQIQRVLDLQLILGQQFHPGRRHLFDARPQLRAECIITTGIIADREHHQRGDSAQSRTTRSNTSPSAATSSTTSGIWPSAWVAHDRQGSKARIATSMWLSRPSVSLRPDR